MLTFRAGSAGSEFAARAMAEYMTSEAGHISGYYGEKSGMLRADVDPVLAERLMIDPDRPISAEELHHVLAGRAADGNAIEGRARQGPTAKKARIAYYDLTFSAPKSFSVAWALGSDDERAALDRCHIDAVSNAMAYIETQIGHARRGKGGKYGTEAGTIAWLKFEDYSARPSVAIASGSDTILAHVGENGDMQRHTHVIVPNIVQARDHVGSINWKSSKGLGGRVHEYGAIYQAFLATELRKIGVDADLDPKTDMAYLPAVPRRIVDAFSKRTVNGLDSARKTAAEQNLNWDALDSERKVNLLKASVARARQAKPDGQSDLSRWREEAKSHKYQYESVIRSSGRGLTKRNERLAKGYDASLPLMEPQLMRRSKFEGSVARVAAAKALIAAGIEDPGKDIYAITRAMRTEGVRQDGQLTELVWGKENNSVYSSFTTNLHIEQEREAISLIRHAASDRSKSLTIEEISAASEFIAGETGKVLTIEQAKFVNELGKSGGAILGVGAAGVGKTAALEVLSHAWHKRGLRTVGVTQAWRQVHGLREAGIGSFTKGAEPEVYATTPFLKRAVEGKIRLDDKTVVVFDEASQIGTRKLLEVMRLQKQYGFSIVALGDSRQCGAIEAGNAVRLFERALGEESIPELTKTIRQVRERERETASLWRQGRVVEALERKDEDGTLRIVPGGYEEAIASAVDLLHERRLANADDPRYTVGITVPTNADVLAIGVEDRRRLQKTGEVGPDARILPAIDQRGNEFDLPISPGTSLRFFRRVHGVFADAENGRPHPARFGDNGSVATIVTIRDDGMMMRNEHNRVAFVAWDRLRDFDQPNRFRVTYGSALTIDARQSATLTDHITVMPRGSEAVHGLKIYTAESRHRMQAWLVTSQGAEMAEVIERRPLGDPRNDIKDRAKIKASIMENIARNLSREAEKGLATDFVRTATNVRHGSVEAGEASWHKDDMLPPPAERQEPWVAKTNLDYWASQVAQGWAAFDDVVDLEYAKRLERVVAAGVQDIDHGLIRDKASDDVVAAIQRYDAAQAVPEKPKAPERKPDRDMDWER